MLSVISVVGMLSCCSSHTVSREPWRNGRVSSANTSIFFPASTAARITPSAVPYPAVASAPALQCVRTVLPSGTSVAPFCADGVVDGDVFQRDLLAPPRSARADLVEGGRSVPVVQIRIRSIAQNRLTAVGRVPASVEQICVDVGVVGRPIAGRRWRPPSPQPLRCRSAADDHGLDGRCDLQVVLASDEYLLRAAAASGRS